MITVDCTPPPGVIQSTRSPAGVRLLRKGPSVREAAGEVSTVTESSAPSL